MTAEPILKKSDVKADLSDRINPIVVKELRQAVQSRFVIAALLTLLSIQVVAIGIYILASGVVLFDFIAGRQAFLMLFTILQVIGMLFVPLYTAVRLAVERSDTNVDLLFITTIKPRSIIAGKMIAALMLTALIYSACMPFMTFTYFLRGIDLPSIFISLGIGFVVVLACAQAAVFVACIPVNRVFKVIFGLIVLIVFGVVFFATVGGVSQLIFRGIAGTEFWEALTAIGLAVFFLTGLFFVMSVALIKPLASNRAAPVRLFITAAWMLTGVAASAGSAMYKEYWPVILWLVTFESIFALALFVAVSERDQPGKRVLRSIPKSFLGRAAAFFFFSGAANGLAWASLMILLTLAAVWVWVDLFPATDASSLIDIAKFMGGMCLYFFCYALTGALLRRHLFKRVGTEVTWLIAAILLVVGSFAPFLIGYLVFFNDQWWKEEFNAWWVGNPFAFSNSSHRVLYSGVAGVWASLVLALNLHWFIERARGFHPSKAIVETTDDAAYQNTITLGLNQ